MAATVVASIGSSAAVAAAAAVGGGAATGGAVGGGVSGGAAGAGSVGGGVLALIYGVQRFSASRFLPINQTNWSFSSAVSSVDLATGDVGLELVGGSRGDLAQSTSTARRQLAGEAPAPSRRRLNSLLNILVVLSIILCILALVQACAHYMYAAVPSSHTQLLMPIPYGDERPPATHW